MSDTIDRDAIRKRIANCRTYNFGMRDADTLAHEDAPAMLELLDAAKAEPLTIDREALAKFLFSRDFGRRNWDDVQMGEQQVYQAEASAVIAHLPAQEAATEAPSAEQLAAEAKRANDEHDANRHRALFAAAFPVEEAATEVEWGVRFVREGHPARDVSYPTEAIAREQSEFGGHLIRRPVNQWQEVPADE